MNRWEVVYVESTGSQRVIRVRDETAARYLATSLVARGVDVQSWRPIEEKRR